FGVLRRPESRALEPVRPQSKLPVPIEVRHAAPPRPKRVCDHKDFAFGASKKLFLPGQGIARKCRVLLGPDVRRRSEEHTSELQSRENLVCRLLLEKKN